MKKFLKKSGKTAFIYLFTFIILIIVYMVLMLLASLIPSSVLEENVRKSSEILLKDGEKKIYDLGYKEEVIFTFTDALIINTAYSIDSNNPIESFLLARKNYIPGQTKIVYPDSQYNLGANENYKNNETGDLYQTKELYGLMHGDRIEDSYEYARYWHGYLVVLRPLLALFDYNAIRIVIAIVAFACITTMLVLLQRKVDLISSIMFLIGLLSISIWVITQSINEILIFLVAIISAIILLLRYKKIKHIGIFFFAVGSIASFIDLLTAPIVTLGINAIIYFLLLHKEKDTTIKESITKLFIIGISWCLGYGLTWLLKWLIIELVFENKSIISQVINQIAFRSGISVENASGSAVLKNIKGLTKIVFEAIIFFAVSLMVTLMIIRFKKKINLKKNLKNCVPYILIFFFPIVWMMLITQHSYTHAFMVYRILIISIISLLIVTYKIFDIEKEEEK